MFGPAVRRLRAPVQVRGFPLAPWRPRRGLGLSGWRALQVRNVHRATVLHQGGLRRERSAGNCADVFNVGSPADR